MIEDEYHIQPCSCQKCRGEELRDAVYDAAMALADKWEEYERLNETTPYKIDGDNTERDQLAEDCDRLADVFRDACRRAKEGK